MIDDMTASTPTAPAPAPQARAVRRAQARDLTSATAARWLTTEATTQLDRAITLSITRYARDHRQQPTWADALNAVDPTLREPMTTAPADWPLPAAVWRRELRLQLMGQLKRTRWITYTATPRSLHIGPQGRAWLTTTGTTPDYHRLGDDTITAPAPPPRRGDPRIPPQASPTHTQRGAQQHPAARREKGPDGRPRPTGP